MHLLCYTSGEKQQHLTGCSHEPFVRIATKSNALEFGCIVYIIWHILFVYAAQ